MELGKSKKRKKETDDEEKEGDKEDITQIMFLTRNDIETVAKIMKEAIASSGDAGTI